MAHAAAELAVTFDDLDYVTQNSTVRLITIAIGLRGVPTSLVRHQPHKAFVLVILMMAVEQGGPGIVGDEIKLDCAESCHVDCISHRPWLFHPPW